MTTLGLLRSGPRSWPELAKGADVVALALELDRLEKTYRVVKTRTADGRWNVYAAIVRRG
jgi:hypothetical protein